MKKEFDKIVRTRRSVRKFKNVEISDDKVKNSILHFLFFSYKINFKN